MKNYNIVEVNKIDRIETAEKTLYKYNNLYIRLFNKRNNINGIPLYSVQVFNQDIKNVTNEYKGIILNGARYSNKNNYLSFQSFNVGNDLERLLNN